MHVGMLYNVSVALAVGLLIMLLNILVYRVMQQSHLITLGVALHAVKTWTSTQANIE